MYKRTTGRSFNYAHCIYLNILVPLFIKLVLKSNWHSAALLLNCKISSTLLTSFQHSDFWSPSCVLFLFLLEIFIIACTVFLLQVKFYLLTDFELKCSLRIIIKDLSSNCVVLLSLWVCAFQFCTFYLSATATKIFVGFASPSRWAPFLWNDSCSFFPKRQLYFILTFRDSLLLIFYKTNNDILPHLTTFLRTFRVFVALWVLNLNRPYIRHRHHNIIILKWKCVCEWMCGKCIDPFHFNIVNFKWK